MDWPQNLPFEKPYDQWAEQEKLLGNKWLEVSVLPIVLASRNKGNHDWGDMSDSEIKRDLADRADEIIDRLGDAKSRGCSLEEACDSIEGPSSVDDCQWPAHLPFEKPYKEWTALERFRGDQWLAEFMLPFLVNVCHKRLREQKRPVHMSRERIFEDYVLLAGDIISQLAKSKAKGFSVMKARGHYVSYWYFRCLAEYRELNKDEHKQQRAGLTRVHELRDTQDDSNTSVDPELQCLSDQNSERLRTRIGRLRDDKQRAVVALRIAGKTYRDIAGAVDISEGHARVLFYRALVTLRDDF